ncbi:MAG: alpha/beta hydrolase [Flavobacteriales bacterium]|nr:alpha/beta hydrolase [Flavobacteriales bacterium]
MRKTLKIGRVDWTYLDSGSGDEVWLAFHGFGQEAEVMMHFMKNMKPTARILSFDLPLHGNTIIKGEAIRIGDVADLLGKALRETGASSCSLVGFSLGGKIVLKLVELVPGRIKEIILIAPDGLRVNPLYWFVTNTLIGKGLFQLVIRFPQPLLSTSKLLGNLGLMNKKIDEFVSSQLSTREKREKVLKTWITFKNLTPNLKDVRSKIWRYHIKPTLVFGTYDRVIHPKLAKKLSGSNCTTSEVIMIDSGHNLITKKHALFLKSKLDPDQQLTS